MNSLAINHPCLYELILPSDTNFCTHDPAARDQMITVRYRAELIPIKITLTKSELMNMKFENSGIYFELSRGISIKQIHLKIHDEFNWLCDTQGNNVKPRTIRSNGHFKRVGILQESGVVGKFCFKEGCRLLHYFDCIGVLGLTTTTMSSR